MSSPASFSVIPGDESTPVKVDEAQFISEFITAESLTRTLETGFGYGRSAIAIISATGSPHTAIDPYQDRYGRLGLSNIESAGFTKHLALVEKHSHIALPELLAGGNKYDFIFIDGDHKFDGIMLDFYYADLLLDDGGYVLFHDTWMRSTQLVMKYIIRNRADYSQVSIPCSNMSLFRKRGSDVRDGVYFREFYTYRSIVKWNLISYLYGGTDSFIKRAARRLIKIIR